MDFISPNLISSGVFHSRLQIDPESFQEARRPIKAVRIRVATCGRSLCSRTFWSRDLIRHFCENHSSGRDLSSHLLLFLSFFFHMSNEDSALFLFALSILFAFRITIQISESQGKALAFGAIIQVIL